MEQHGERGWTGREDQEDLSMVDQLPSPTYSDLMRRCGAFVSSVQLPDATAARDLSKQVEEVEGGHTASSSVHYGSGGAQHTPHHGPSPGWWHSSNAASSSTGNKPRHVLDQRSPNLTQMAVRESSRGTHHAASSKKRLWAETASDDSPPRPSPPTRMKHDDRTNSLQGRSRGKASRIPPWQTYKAKNVDPGPSGRLTITLPNRPRGGIFGKAVSSRVPAHEPRDPGLSVIRRSQGSVRSGQAQRSGHRQDGDWRKAWLKPRSSASGSGSRSTLSPPPPSSESSLLQPESAHREPELYRHGTATPGRSGYGDPVYRYQCTPPAFAVRHCALNEQLEEELLAYQHRQNSETYDADPYSISSLGDACVPREQRPLGDRDQSPISMYQRSFESEWPAQGRMRNRGSTSIHQPAVPETIFEDEEMPHDMGYATQGYPSSSRPDNFVQHDPWQQTWSPYAHTGPDRQKPEPPATEVWSFVDPEDFATQLDYLPEMGVRAQEVWDTGDADQMDIDQGFTAASPAMTREQMTSFWRTEPL